MYVGGLVSIGLRINLSWLQVHIEHLHSSVLFLHMYLVHILSDFY